MWPADQSQLTWPQYSVSGPIRGEYGGQLTNHSSPGPRGAGAPAGVGHGAADGLAQLPEEAALHAALRRARPPRARTVAVARRVFTTLVQIEELSIAEKYLMN